MEDINRLGHIELILAIGGFLFLFIMVLIIARSITRSLSRLAKATEQIATGNLDTEIPPAGSGDETGKLTESFNTMRRSLKEHIRELTEITAEKQRIKSELNIAHDIQMSFIPKTFPPFPERTEFDIYAVYKSAREVGGDFYDYFFVDDEHLFFAIGDVSDKGVPAALFMAATITLLKVNAIKEIAPDRVLAKVNQKLSRENDSSMFVTIFCGVLNTKTGEVLYANAGHNPPLLLCKGKDAAFVGDTMGVIAGVLEDAEFEMKSVMLHPGDILLTYTDGVTEAMDKDTHLFLSERLQREVNTSREKTMKDMVHGIMDKVRDFSDGAPQSDDITILALLYRGRY
jgi:sigma-B regulation protein RsbU (phosphoserine phosphatase)